MKNNFSKAMVILIVLLGLINTQHIYGQQPMKYVTVCYIFDNLVFGLRFNSNIVEINKLIIKQIQERGVDFKLESKEEENSFRKIGATDELIKAIRGNFSKEFQHQIDLYKKFTDNYAGKTIEQRRTAIDAAKEFIEKFGDVEDNKDIIKYLKKIIPELERRIATEIQK